jgi:hypothetical protein
MRRTSFLALAAITVAAAQSACSLVVTSPEPVIAGCTTNMDCDPLNTRDHIAANACQRWQCDHRNNLNLCRVTPRDNDEDGDPAIDPACPTTQGQDCDDNDHDIFAAQTTGDGGTPTPHEEWCDGKDNNCNGVIDEDGTTRQPITGVALRQANIDRMTTSQISQTTVTALIHADSVEGLATFMGAQSMDMAPHALSFGIRTSPTSESQTMPMANCPRGTGSIMSGCNVVEGGIDSAELQIIAGITNAGCGAGMLYLGYYLPTAATGNIVLRDYEGLSNVFRGVDASGMDCGNCTAGGAVRPRVAAFRPASPAAPPQAIVTYLNAPQVGPDPADPSRMVAYDECRHQPVDVRVLGAFLMNIPGSDVTHWVMGAGDGRSRVLGRSNGSAAAMATFLDRGYFVAYGNDAGNVSLHFIPIMQNAVLSSLEGVDVMPTDASDDAPVCNTPDAGTFGSGHIVEHEEPCPSCDAGVRTAPGVPELPASSDGILMTHGSASPATSVAIALSGQNGSETDIGVTWVEGAPPCGMRASSASVWFSRVRYNGDAHTFTGTTPIQVSPMGIGADSPSITYVDHGFVTPGFTRNGMTAMRDGGYFVSYIDYSANQSRVRVRRVAQFDGQLITEAPIDITDPSVTVGVASPRLYTLGNSAEPVNFLYGSFSGATPGVIGGSLQCRGPSQ